jgi:hypothetical protein
MYFNHLHLSKKQITAVLVFLFTVFGIQSSYADPGRTWEIDVNALTYANQNPSILTDDNWCFLVCQVPTTIYDINGVSARDRFTFNISNVTNQNHVDPALGVYFTLVAWFKDSEGFDVTYTSNNVTVPSWNPNPFEPVELLVGHAVGGDDDESVVKAFEDIKMELTLGDNPFIDANWLAGKFGFISFDQYYLFRFKTDGQWTESSSPAPAPTPAASIRRSTNLTFAQSLYASDTLSDEDGELRKTVDQIMNKYGSLIK